MALPRNHRVALVQKHAKTTKAPPIAEPKTHDGITRPGSAVANGIAPSVINENPKTQLEIPARRSCSGEFIREESCCDRCSKWWDHPADHNCRHQSRNTTDLGSLANAPEAKT